MKEVNWEKVANEYGLTPIELEEQVCQFLIIVSQMRLEKQVCKTKVIRESVSESEELCNCIITYEITK